MKATDFVKQKSDKKTKSSGAKGKKSALIDWIGKRRSKNVKGAKGKDDDDEE